MLGRAGDRRTTIEAVHETIFVIIAFRMTLAHAGIYAIRRQIKAFDARLALGGRSPRVVVALVGADGASAPDQEESPKEGRQRSPRQ
jgi:hypothetical protein